VRRIIRAIAKYQTALGVPLTVIGLTLADRIIPFLYGEGFEDSVLVFQLLSSITLVRLLQSTLATSLTSVEPVDEPVLVSEWVLTFPLGEGGVADLHRRQRLLGDPVLSTLLPPERLESTAFCRGKRNFGNSMDGELDRGLLPFLRKSLFMVLG
jgi:hypothetical protein